MLDALSEAYSTAKALYRRHTALPSLEAACELCKFTIAKCEALMELRDADDSASDSGDDSGDDEGRQRDWTKWLTGKCQGVTRLQLLKELTPKLQLCVQTLQLALVALPLRIDRAALLPRAPFRYVPAAQEQALRLAQQLELGRVRAAGLRVAAGELFRSVRYTGGEGAGVWRSEGPCAVMLVCTRPPHALRPPSAHPSRAPATRAARAPAAPSPSKAASGWTLSHFNNIKCSDI
jgi:hypothetical protein